MQERPENVPLDPALTHTATWVALSDGGWRLAVGYSITYFAEIKQAANLWYFLFDFCLSVQ